MAWLVLTLLIGVFFWGGVIAAFVSEGEGKFGGIAVSVIAAVVWIALSLFMSVHTLGTGQVALVYDFSGKLSGSKLEPGVIWTAPWQHVKKENVLLQTETFTLDATNSAVSKDQQNIFANIALNYEVDPRDVVDLYRTVGPSWKVKLVDSRVLQDFKEVTSRFSAQEITTRRESLRTETRDRLKVEFRPYSIKVIDFFVRNLHYSNTYEQSIDRKNQQVQRALQAEAKVAQSRAEAAQRVAQARGRAEATLVEASAQAKANRLKRQTLTPLLVRQNAIDKLNPQVSVIYVPAGADFFLGQPK